MTSSQKQAVALVFLTRTRGQGLRPGLQPAASHDAVTGSRWPVPFGSRLVILRILPASVSARFHPPRPKGLSEED